jgi:hypothetical protein
MIAYCLLTLLNIVSLAVAFNNYWVVDTGFFFFFFCAFSCHVDRNNRLIGYAW